MNKGYHWHPRIIEFIIEHVEKGETGVKTMELYEKGFSVKAINASIRQLLIDGIISISSPSTGYRLTHPEEYGVKQALRTKNFDIKLI